jgi:hypothetical protein
VTLPVGDHRGHLRCVIVLIIELPGDEERWHRERPEILIGDPVGPPLECARGEQGLGIAAEGDRPRPGRELAAAAVIHAIHPP